MHSTPLLQLPAEERGSPLGVALVALSGAQQLGLQLLWAGGQVWVRLEQSSPLGVALVALPVVLNHTRPA